MGSRNLTTHELIELNYPVRLTVRGYNRASLRRTAGGRRFEIVGGCVYMTSTAHACRFAAACPEAIWEPPWPVRLSLRMDGRHEWTVRDALRGICGDQGYVMASDRLGTIHLYSVWDAHLLVRSVTRVGLAGSRVPPKR